MRISKTKLEDFNCPRRGEYKHLKKIELIGTTDLALVYGDAIHKGMDYLFTTWFNGARDKAVEGAQDIFKATFKKYEGPGDPSGRRHLVAGLDTMSAFAEQWLSRYPWEDIEGEKKYVMTLKNSDGSTDEFVCIIDRRGKLAGVPTLIEFKTTGWPHLFTIEPNVQVETQALTVAANQGEFIYRNALFMLIHVDDRAEGGYIVPKRAKAGADLQSIFRPLPVSLTESKIAEAERDIRSRIKAIKMYAADGYYPKVTERCGDFGGCQYKRLCILNAEDRGLIEATQYKPIEYKKEEPNE